MAKILEDLIAERESLTDEQLHALYLKHKESPYIENPLSEERFRPAYRRLLDVEIAAWEALEAQNWGLHDKLDRESDALCRRLGF